MTPLMVEPPTPERLVERAQGGDRQAFEQLVGSHREAVEAGFTDLDHMRGDPDLEPIRDDPGFKAIIDEENKVDKKRGSKVSPGR